LVTGTKRMPGAWIQRPCQYSIPETANNETTQSALGKARARPAKVNLPTNKGVKNV
jgi:hypothetical protein